LTAGIAGATPEAAAETQAGQEMAANLERRRQTTTTKTTKTKTTATRRSI
jgi:hypothetical protein